VADQLTVEHRQQIDQIRRSVAAQLALLWSDTFDTADIRGSWTRFAAVALPIIADGYDLSAQDAQAYLRRFRRNAGVSGRAPSTAIPVLSQVRVRKSLEFTARYTTLRGIQVGKTAQQAAQSALVRTIGSAGRFVSEGSHATVREGLKADPQATGWRRIAASDACDFCAALASNGVYSHKVDFSAHDHCACTARPVFGERPTARRPRSTGRATSEPGPRPAPASSSLSDRVAAHRTFAEGAGWDVRTSGRRMIGTKAGGQRIVWELTESGVWRIEQLSRS
jgi:hypothetical protein